MITLTLSPARTASLGKWAKAAFVLFAIVAGSAMLVRLRGEILAALGSADWRLLALAFVAGTGYLLVSFVVWRVFVTPRAVGLGRFVLLRAHFLGQIGKYLPGGLWSFVGVAELCREAGIDRRTTLASQIITLLVSLCLGATLGIVAVPQAFGEFRDTPLWVALSLVPLAALLHPAARKRIFALARIDLDPTPLALCKSATAGLVMWGFAGLHLWLIARALGAGDAAPGLLLATGIYAVAWVTGFLVLIAPAGVGAREAVLVGLLSIRLPAGQAIAVALLSRVVLTMADFLLAAAGVALNRLPAKR